MNAFLDQIAKLGAGRLVVMFGTAAGLAFGLMALAGALGGPGKVVLYSGLDMAAVSEATAELDQAGVAYELGAGGTAILVSPDDVTPARLRLAAEGLPKGGSVGYEIFDQDGAMSATRFVQDVNKVRALEGEIARTIRAIDGVADARVHLAIPERQLFERDPPQPTASVWIDLRHTELATRHARTIRNLVANAVPGMDAARVTILDDNGRLLAGGDGDDASAGALDDRRAGVEERYRQRIQSLVESIAGPGAADVAVTVEMDFSRVTESQEIFDPEGRVLRSSQTTEEAANETDRDGADATSASENLPGEPTPALAGPQSQANETRTTETVNYEISRTTRQQIFETGVVQRLSIAVMVDGVYTPPALDENGELPEGAAPTYTPRSQEDLQRIAALVRAAVGFDESRGDTLSVENFQFARTPLPERAGAPIAFDKNDIFRAAELGVLVIVALMIVFLVARPLVKIASPSTPALAPLAAAAAGGDAAIAGAPGAAGLPAPADEQGVEIQKIDGKISGSSVKKVAEIVDSHPDEAVSVLRTWLHDG